MAEEKPGFAEAVRAAAFGPDPNAPDFVPPVSKVTDRRPLSEIQAELRSETEKRARKVGGRM